MINRTPRLSSGAPDIVIIPARDEGASVGDVVQSVRARVGCEVVVIDDASVDNTGSLAEAAGAIVLWMPFRVGAWGAVQAGMHYALGAGCQLALTMDADGQHPAAAVETVCAPVLNDDSDLAIGVCPERASALRRLAWLVFRRLTGFEFEDLTSGFRAYNLDAMRVLVSREACMLSYQDVGVLLLLGEAGLRAAEVKVDMRPRTNGKSRVYDSWPTVGKYLMETTLLCVGKWRPSWQVSEMFITPKRPDR